MFLVQTVIETRRPNPTQPGLRLSADGSALRRLNSSRSRISGVDGRAADARAPGRLWR